MKENISRPKFRREKISHSSVMNDWSGLVWSGRLTLLVCGDGGQAGRVEGNRIVRKCRCQIRRVQSLDVWQTHAGLVGQHPEGEQSHSKQPF